MQVHGLRISALLVLSCVLTASPGPQGRGETVPDKVSADGWSSIRAAYEAGRHASYETEGGLQARNPGQQWDILFDGRGFWTEPDAGDWRWGLQLERFGFAGSERRVTAPTGVNAEGSRVSYDWDSTLEEWYVNDSRGLEHGYTVHRRPPIGDVGGGAPLTLTLAVRGELSPVVAEDGRGVRFLDPEGAVAVKYTGLSVFDADRRALEARFRLIEDGLLLSIDERGARYPLTIDPIAQQQAYLKASNTDGNDLFGWSVAVSGDTVVVGAHGEDSSATGVNGNQGNNSAPDSGAAYVFVRNGTTWSQQAYLKASNTNAVDYFGFSVAVWGDTVVVGAEGETSNATGVNGNQSDNSLGMAGAAYVFVRNGTTWSQQAYLKASNTDANDSFGRSVAVSGGTIVVGAWREASNATVVNGDQGNNSATEAGAAYVFVRIGTTWTQQAYLKASNTDALDNFGASTALSGNTIVVGAFGEDSNASGVNGYQGDNSAPGSGAAYVFLRTGKAWGQQAYLKASNSGAGDLFGRAVDVLGDTAVVGAYAEDSGATGVNGNQGDNSTPWSGAAYLFVRGGTSWSQQAYLKASNTDADDGFGLSVALLGNAVVVGAEGEDSSAVGVNGNQGNNGASKAGAAYLFLGDGTSWRQEAYLKASNTGSSDRFAGAVAGSGNTVLIGATGEDSTATGVNGDQGNNSAYSAGAAYVFEVESAPGNGFCFGDLAVGSPCPCSNDNDGSVPGSGCANGAFASGARLAARGLASVSADTVVLVTTGLDPNNTGLYFQADNSLNGGWGLHFGDGLRCAGGGLIRLQVRASNATGTSLTTIAIGAKGRVAPGNTKRYQCWYRDTSGSQPCGIGVNDFNLSNGYQITWLP